MTLLRTGDHVRRVVEDRLHQARNVPGTVLEVGGIEDEDAATRGRSARREGVRDASLAAVGHHAHEWMLGRDLAQRVGGPVAAAVVDDDDLAGIREREQGFARLPYELGKVLGLVLRRHQDAHVGQRRAGRQAHSRLRMRAGRMLNWSRYFATVRRAILTPFCANISTICWSVSGFRGSSSATIF